MIDCKNIKVWAKCKKKMILLRSIFAIVDLILTFFRRKCMPVTRKKQLWMNSSEFSWKYRFLFLYKMLPISFKNKFPFFFTRFITSILGIFMFVGSGHRSEIQNIRSMRSSRTSRDCFVVLKKENLHFIMVSGFVYATKHHSTVRVFLTLTLTLCSNTML